MARSLALAAVAMMAVVALRLAGTFVPAPGAPRADEAALAGTAVGVAGLPGMADAFYYDGKEYFDITFG
eukprot:CAMPEP_0171092390 /NCGR_PEP_ID=MMETSP0766_2-20121228/35661_1 /TAXON_ID=439317 /ORGANISM="Gambierdiscus australes, Strain CAWD 149" /LENGTH=68 /DNA_ID=CAMNT_0011550615 /DNA_START=71 /DNA_END=274 /DNA_ORIENTATION=+